MWRILCRVASALVLTACGGTSITTPRDLSYPSPETAIVGQPISVNPTVTGSVTSYSISPALPAGLSISSTTGTISGTPTSFDAKTTYTITATNGAGSTTFTWVLTVNPRVGPSISCTSPADATMVNRAPGSVVPFTGSATDATGVMAVSVNGAPVGVLGDGSFSAPITSRFGINFVDITATDSFGLSSTKVCAFLVADQYGSESGSLGDAISLSLTQGAWDDGNRAGGLDDFDDILTTVLKSAHDTLDSALRAANPIKPMSCDQQVCLPFVGCHCELSTQVTYLGSSMNGPNTTSLNLVGGGVHSHASMENIVLDLDVNGSAAGIGFDTHGTVNIASVGIDFTIDVALSGGQPHITPGTVSVGVGNIDTHFSGISGTIINIVASLAQGTLRNIVARDLQNFVTNNFIQVLDSAISGLNISTLGASFNVPRLDSTGTIPVSLGVGFSSVDTSAARMLVGVSTRFSAMPSQSIPSLGVPLPPGAVLDDPSVVAPATTGVAVHVGLLNQLLHSLWRAGFGDATISGVRLETHLPPVAMIDGSGAVHIHLGGVIATLNMNGLPTDARLNLGATAHTSVSLMGNALRVGAITIDELHLSGDSLQLDAAQQMMAESMLRPIVQQYANQALSSLPAFPLPTFAIPPSLAQYGLPSGGQLGITNPSLSAAPQHFLLLGGFGIR